MTELAKNIYMIQIPLKNSPLKATNCYLIKGENRGLLVDTAFNNDESEALLLDELAHAGLTPENTDVFITHLHVDHSGLAARFKRSSNHVYVSTRDGATINQFQQAEYWKDIEQTNAVMGAPADVMPKVSEHPARVNNPTKTIDFTYIDPGAFIEIGEYRFEVIDLKGHTPGQIGLFDEKTGYLFAGDHILGDISPNIAAWDLEEDYLQMFLDSLVMVKRMDVRRLFIAHRTNPEDINRRIDELLEHHEQRLDTMLDVLKKENRPMNSYEVACRIEWARGKTLKELSRSQYTFACHETMAHLQHLMFHNRAVCEVLPNGERRYSAV